MKFKLLHLIPILFLSACAHMPDNYVSSEKIDTARLSTVKKIALLDVPIPSGIWLGYPGSAEAAGLFGPLVAMAAASHEGDRIVNPAALSAIIHDDTKTWLESAGFEVTTMQARRSDPSKMLQSYDQFRDLDVDAILEIGTANIGFKPEIGKFRSSDMELSPEVWMVFRLVSTKTGETIVESSVGYSSFFYSDDLAGGVILGPRSHTFKGVEAIENNRGDAVEKLEFAIKGATEYVASIIANDNRDISYSAYGNAKLQASEEKSTESSLSMRTILAGSTWSGTTSKGIKFHEYFAPDGVMFGRATTKRNTEYNDSGTWEINQAGQYCRAWKKWFDGEHECMNVSPISGNHYMVQAIGEPEMTEVVIQKGDTQGLDTRVANRKATAAEMVATLSAIQKSIGVRSLSGKYVSEITGKAAQFLKSSFTETSDRILTLSQDGRNLTGELGTSGNIWGKASGMSVTFEYFVNGMDGKGEWDFAADGSTATGTWVPNSTTYNLSDGPYEWNLTRVESSGSGGTNSDYSATLATTTGSVQTEAVANTAMDLTGVYVSNSIRKAWVLRHKPRLKIKLRQNGDTISGEFQENLDGPISGKIIGNTIEFTWEAGNCSSGVATFSTETEGAVLTGSMVCRSHQREKFDLVFQKE